MNLIPNMCSEITRLKSLSHPPGANKLAMHAILFGLVLCWVYVLSLCGYKMHLPKFFTVIAWGREVV